MRKVDLKRELNCYRATRDTPRTLVVPDLQYLAVDGHGDPNTPAFAEAAGALYPVAYALKRHSRLELDRDFVVMPLEGLWWAEDLEAFTAARDKARWDWTLMIMAPDWITADMVDAAVRRTAARGAPSRLEEVRFETHHEGLCVQALHVGAFDAEGPLLRRIHEEYLPEHDLGLTGTHHEIYLSDARRVPPERLRTILRQPVRSLAS